MYLIIIDPEVIFHEQCNYLSLDILQSTLTKFERRTLIFNPMVYLSILYHTCIIFQEESDFLGLETF